MTPSPHSHHKPYFLERKKIQRFIDFGRHDQHRQPDIYMKLVCINIRRQSCQILSTLDEFQQRNLCPRERGQERELTCFVTMKNIFLFKHLGKKILSFENLSSCLSFSLVLETCLAKVICRNFPSLTTVRQLTLKAEHLVSLLSS